LRLVSIIVGDDAASQSYAVSQQRTAESLGIHYEVQKIKIRHVAGGCLGADRATQQVQGRTRVIINKPLPSQLDFKVLVDAITPDKDIEG